METTKEFQSQFGIRMHAQIQVINGRTYEFQPEELLCEECWRYADSALAHASYYGSATVGDGNGHAMTVTKISKKAGA